MTFELSVFGIVAHASLNPFLLSALGSHPLLIAVSLISSLLSPLLILSWLLNRLPWSYSRVPPHVLFSLSSPTPLGASPTCGFICLSYTDDSQMYISVWEMTWWNKRALILESEESALLAPRGYRKARAFSVRCLCKPFLFLAQTLQCRMLFVLGAMNAKLLPHNCFFFPSYG